MNLAAFAVWGANTDVGKTLVSAGLCLTAAREAGGAGPAVLYLKPVQTGFPVDSDARTVLAASKLAGGDCVHLLGPHAEVCISSDAERAGLLVGGASSAGKAAVVGHTLYAWKDAVGPHLAVEREGCVPTGWRIASARTLSLCITQSVLAAWRQHARPLCEETAHLPILASGPTCRPEAET